METKRTHKRTREDKMTEKEWIFECEEYGNYHYARKGKLFTECVDKTLIDQIRREAQKELLDEIEKQFNYHADDKDLQVHICLSDGEWEEFRAKTLGEKK